MQGAAKRNTESEISYKIWRPTIKSPGGKPESVGWAKLKKIREKIVNIIEWN